MDLTDWPDVAELVRALDDLADWDRSEETVLTRAPGRLDVMGGIADYSGSLVLELPLKEATAVAYQNDPARRLTIVSRGVRERRFSAPLAEIESLDYDDARAYFGRDPAKAWAAYAAGAFVVAMREHDFRPSTGARIVIRSDVPEGKGVASSAALSVAMMSALDAAHHLGLEAHQIAFSAQNVENLVVGAPCGIMDPMTAVLGESDRLLAILCQPAEVRGQLAIPDELAFWGIDSGIAHAVSGSDYTSVRIGAFMGRRILERTGYLANLTPSELEERYRWLLPESISGATFLERYGETGDSVTRVDPNTTYRVREATTHPVYEHFRVQAFARLLASDALDNAPLLGELMYQSHASYSACGLGSPGTDRIVALAREAGPERGIYGAKITGGGSGGTVAVLARRDATAALGDIVARYGEERGFTPAVFRGSSPGAGTFGHRVLRN